MRSFRLTCCAQYPPIQCHLSLASRIPPTGHEIHAPPSSSHAYRTPGRSRAFAEVACVRRALEDRPQVPRVQRSPPSELASAGRANPANPANSRAVHNECSNVLGASIVSPAPYPRPAPSHTPAVSPRSRTLFTLASSPPPIHPLQAGIWCVVLLPRLPTRTPRSGTAARPSTALVQGRTTQYHTLRFPYTT
ncbi:hypothetical protein B0H17DRAFT_1339263 [Mycena rosella]|uniref:Uncharacterized protein n=1 Tax=Mycena rosella TaxID=1033263 RepID=A0AAD7C6U2_MYCRO|nr:hypothetical protein B0H17DRAFT_1339263 [Mycena rosella]